MRTSTKLWATALLFSFSAFSLSAKDLYVASAENGGAAENDGLTPETPVAYLSQLNSVIEAGDVIHVNGMIMMSQDPNQKPDRTSGYVHQQAGAKGHQGFVIMGGAWKDLTFIGEGVNSGFDSEHKGRVFRLHGGSNITFQNLTFKNGRDLVNDGGNGFWIGASVNARFIDCTFSGHTPDHADPDSPTDYKGSNGRGGAIHKTEMGNLYLYNCTFMANENRQGNAINLGGGTFVASGCRFMANTSKINGEGGAIFFWTMVNDKPINATIEHCLFMGNATAGSGGAIAFRETAGRENAGHTVTIKDCTFYGNSANMGGAFIIDNIVKNPSKIKVLNSTFISNVANLDGGTISMRAASPGSEFTMVNCTVTENITKGNGGHGAALSITNQETNPKTNCVKRIYNCIFQRNYAVDNAKNTTSDLTLRDPLETGEFEAYNTYFGRLTNNPIPDGAAINCETNYMPGSINDINEENFAQYNLSGLSDDIAKVYGPRKYIAPFIDTNAPGLTFGNAEYLTQFGLDKDQIGNVRKVSGNSCAVGSIEMDEAGIDGLGDKWTWNPILTGIENTTEDKDQIEIYVRNGEIIVGTGNNDANIQLYNMNGSLLKATTGSMEINGINNGFYIVKAVLDNQISVKKIWIK